MKRERERGEGEKFNMLKLTVLAQKKKFKEQKRIQAKRIIYENKL